MSKRTTRYTGVRYHGDTLYYRVTLASGKRAEIKFGQGTPRQAFDARLLRQKQEDQIRHGLIDPRQAELERHAAQPILAIMEEYLDHLRGKGDSPGHVKNTEANIRACMAACNVERLLELDAHSVGRWLADLTLSARSKNAKRTSILGLCRWAYDYGRAPRNVLPSGLIQKFDENADRRRLSRAMTRQESAALFQALLDPEKMVFRYNKTHRDRKTASERRVFYLLAANTGLRWAEVSRLRWGDIHLEAGLVIVPAGQTKNGKQAELPLLPAVVEALREHRPPEPKGTAKVFSGTPGLKTWKQDLLRAAVISQDADGNLIGYVDDMGRRLDRKCLRTSFCTWLKEAGVDLRDAQQLMRHSDPKLTSNIYTDIRVKNLRTAVEKLTDATTEQSIPSLVRQTA